MDTSMIKKREFDDQNYLGTTFTRIMAKDRGIIHWISRSTPDTIIITWRDEIGIKRVKRYDREYVIRQFTNGHWIKTDKHYAKD